MIAKGHDSILKAIFPGKDLQVVVVVLFDLFFLCILQSYKPHIMGPIRILASLSSVAITLTMYCGLVLKTVEGIDKEVEYKLSIELFLISINVAVAVYAAKQVFPLAFLIKACKDRRKKKRAGSAHRLDLKKVDPWGRGMGRGWWRGSREGCLTVSAL